MNEQVILDIFNEMLWIIIKVSAPMLLVSLIIGLIVSIFQTVTSIQEQTLTFVPKLIGIFATLMICGSWILNNISDFISQLWTNFSVYIR